jgi:translation initiation factor IF-1
MRLGRRPTVDRAAAAADSVETVAVAVRIVGSPATSQRGGTCSLPPDIEAATHIGQKDQRNSLPKEDAIEVMGKVVEKFKAGMFAIELDAGKTVLATMAGRLRRNRIKVSGGRLTIRNPGHRY